MKYIYSLISILMLMSFITGCGPVYKREYSFIPPKTDVGRMCISQCVQGKNACEQTCRMNNDNCRAQAREQAYYEYKEYKRDRIREGKEIKKTLSDFDTSSRCNSSCNCEPTYRSCYSACGGQVLYRDVCVAFCDKA